MGLEAQRWCGYLKTEAVDHARMPGLAQTRHEVMSHPLIHELEMSTACWYTAQFCWTRDTCRPSL